MSGSRATKCPTCGARPGQPCATGRRTTHWARLVRATLKKKLTA